MKWFAILACVVLFAVLAGCARPQLLGTWVNPEEALSPLASVMVVAVAHDAKTRQLHEEEVVAKLLELHPMRVITSYDVALGKADAYPEPQQLLDAVHASGVDAVLSWIVLWVHQDLPRRTSMVQPQPIGEHRWRGWEAFYTRVFYAPPRVQLSNAVIAESYLYDVRRDTLLWSGKATIPTDDLGQSHGLAGLAESLLRHMLAKRFFKDEVR